MSNRPGIFAVFIVDPKTNYPIQMVFPPNNWASCEGYRLTNMLRPV